MTEQKKKRFVASDRVALVLVGHGSPPKDYPPQFVGEYMNAEMRLESGDPSVKEPFKKLDRQVRSHPRTAANDPYWQGMNELAERIKKSGSFLDVIIAFNEFCAPTIEEAMGRAAQLKPEVIVVISTMVIRGGGHSEKEIPDSVNRAAQKPNNIRVIYAWPYDLEAKTEFFITQAKKFITESAVS